MSLGGILLASTCGEAGIRHSKTWQSHSTEFVRCSGGKSETKRLDWLDPEAGYSHCDGSLYQFDGNHQARFALFLADNSLNAIQASSDNANLLSDVQESIRAEGNSCLNNGLNRINLFVRDGQYPSLENLQS